MNNFQTTYKTQNTRSWHERILRNIQPGNNTLPHYPIFPKWIIGKSVLVFAISFALCVIVFQHAVPLEYVAYSTVSLLFFFYGIKFITNHQSLYSGRKFAKELFIWALGIRLIWVLFCYFYHNEALYGRLDGCGDDNGWYMDFAQGVAKWLQGDIKIPLERLLKRYSSPIDDSGYPFWLGILYVLSFDSSDVFVPFMAKSIMGAYSCLCVYRLAKRHFDVRTALLAGLFMCFNPYTIFWCSSMLKEAEMIFLCCVFLDKTDQVLSSGKKITVKGLLPGLLAAFALFFFRAPLAVVAFLAVLTHLLFASGRVMNAGKKVMVGVIVGVLLMIGIGDRIQSQSQHLLEEVKSNSQRANMEWRAERKDGANSFAKYAGAAVFAPLIFTLPFPTFTMADEAQVMQMELSGANFIKNILSYFVIIVLIFLLLSGEWRKHVFILAYTLGYHIILVMSVFAQSGRFHMPVFPMFLLFAAYGIQLAQKNVRMRRWFSIALMIEVAACIAWNWFKLAGRGMI